ncbi:MAG: C25 family cysteine peptidase [Bacteroidota bacterium]|nr:C25 family cysteine peptidase [Bacteroidota bacterium]
MAAPSAYIRRGCAVLSFLAVGLTLLPLSGKAQESPFHVERIQADFWRISVVNSEPHIIPPSEDRPNPVVSMQGYRSIGPPASARLPWKRFPFAVPPGGRLTVRIVALHEEKLESLLGTRVGDAKTAPPARVRDITERADSERSPYVRLDAPRSIDGLVEQGVCLEPVRVDADQGSVYWARSLTMEIRIHGITTASTPSLARLPEPLSEQVTNAADAAAWIVPRQPSSPPVGSFPRAGAEYVKVVTRREGVHIITKRDIEEAGVPTAGIDPRTFRLFLLGQEHPLIVRGEEDGSFDEGDAIEFYAPRREGENGEYFDYWSDDQAFFLSWGETTGRRFRPRDGSPPGTSPVVSSRARLHLEEDRYFHLGDHDETDGNTTEYLPGKRWMWGYLLKKDSLVIPFAVDGVSDDTASLTFRVKHSSRDPARVRVSLNGAVLTEYDVRDYEISTRTVALPRGILQTGTNTLVFLNVQIVPCPPENPTCTIERFYVDWAELAYRVPLRASNDAFVFDKRGDGGGSETIRAEITGFSDTAVTVIDLTDTTILTGVEVSGSSAPFTAAAGVKASDLYVFYAPSALLRPVGMARVSPPDLREACRDKDYIVITHPAFTRAAERLAAYRAKTDGFRTLVVSVEDVYDVFANGRKHPRAVRDFLRTAYFLSGEPKPRFAVLMGDASWDPKKNMSSSFKDDFIPTYGNPVSDNWYVMFSEDSLDVTPWMHIGRIPAETAEQAEGVVDKIIDHESRPAEEWDNRFLFSVGGKSALEQEFYLKPPVKYLVRTWLEPYCLEPRVIVKRSPSLPVSYDDIDTLVSELNAGASWFYFIGHGGTRIIDVGIDRPDLFSLKGKYPFFLTMSCNTAHFAEPVETGLNEKFTMSADNGAIATYGTSGLGEIGHDNILSEGLFEGMLKYNLGTFGELSTYAKKRLITVTGLSDAFTRSAVHQYEMLGDPAAHVRTPATSDLSIKAEWVETTPPSLVQLDPVVVTARIRNRGRCFDDTVDVRLTAARQGTVLHQESIRVPPFVLEERLSWRFQVRDVTGPIEITVHIDPDGKITDADPSNNIATIRRTVMPRGVQPVFPLDHAVLQAVAPVVFIVAGPSRMPEKAPGLRMEIEVSGDPSFSRTGTILQDTIGDVYTWFEWTPPALPFAPLYWRARMSGVEGVDTSWSVMRSFLLTDSAVQGEERWRQFDSAQFARNVLTSVLPTSGGCVLGMASLTVEAFSAGANQAEIITAVLRIGGVDYAPNRRGFNVAVIDPGSGSITDTAVFDTYADAAHADAMARFLDALPDGRVIAVAVRDDANGYPPVIPGGTNITSGLRAALSRYGALLVDSIGFQDSYAFIGSRTDRAVVREQWAHYGTAKAEVAMEIRAKEGRMASPVVGPASLWKNCSWECETPEETGMDLFVYGLSREGDSLLAMVPDAPSSGSLGLDGVPAERFPFIRLETVLKRRDAGESPRLLHWDAAFVSVFPEIGVTTRTVHAESDHLREGEPLVVQAVVHNAGRSDARDVLVALDLTSGQSRRVEAVIPVVPAGRNASSTIRLTLPTVGLRGEQNAELAVNPDGRAVEYYTGNNVWSKAFVSERDAYPPRLSVLFDGVPVSDGDFVSPRPVISILVTDESPLPVTDTSAVQIFLDGKRVWLNQNPDLTYTFPSEGREKVNIRFTPDFTPAGMGAVWHNLAVSAMDASGNKADSIPYQVRFRVSNEDAVDEIIPYPSPSRGPLDFTFRVRGSITPEEATVKIYTVAGRCIRTIEASPGSVHIGFNRIPWDGRDAEGAELANGTYFYKLIVKRRGTQTETVGTFSILR